MRSQCRLALIAVTLVLASTVVANLGFGYLADRSGHKLVLVIGGLATVAGNILAANSQSLIEVYGVFVFVGIAMASMNVSDLTISLDFAPVADRPTYIGLSTTALAPFAFLAPLLGGLLADGIGYAGLFWVAGITSALGVGLLILFVRDPRHKLAEVRAPV